MNSLFSFGSWFPANCAQGQQGCRHEGSTIGAKSHQFNELHKTMSDELHQGEERGRNRRVSAPVIRFRFRNPTFIPLEILETKARHPQSRARQINVFPHRTRHCVFLSLSNTKLKTRFHTCLEVFCSSHATKVRSPFCHVSPIPSDQQPTTQQKVILGNAVPLQTSSGSQNHQATKEEPVPFEMDLADDTKSIA